MLSKEETVLLLKPTSRDVWSGGGVGGRERRERERDSGRHRGGNPRLLCCPGRD